MSKEQQFRLISSTDIQPTDNFLYNKLGHK